MGNRWPFIIIARGAEIFRAPLQPGMGFPVFGQDIQVVSPAGIAPGGVGTPTVSLKNRTLFPAGIAPGRFGHPAVHYPQDARLTNYSLLLTM